MRLFNVWPKLAAAVFVAALALGYAPKSEAVAFLYSGGHCMNTSELAGNGDTVLGGACGFSNDDATWAFALSGGFGAYSAIVTGESTPYSGLSASTYAAINTYIMGGGRVIVGGAHGPEVNTLNAITGFSAVNSGVECGSEPHIAITAAAAGTTFAGGPATLESSSCTSFMSSLPGSAVVFYTHPTGDFGATAGSSAMFMSTLGAGLVGAYGFDSCCGTPAGDSAWYDVLHSALTYSATAAPAPGVLALLGLGLLGFGARRRLK